jgi:hypothetical protein
MRKQESKVMEVTAELSNALLKNCGNTWLGPCGNPVAVRIWYQYAKTDESLVLWPGSVIAYKRRTRAVAEQDYILSGKPESSKNIRS